MVRQALALAFSLACGGSAAAPTATEDTGAEAPRERSPELEELVELAEAEGTREDALVRANELAAELAEADEGRREDIASALGEAMLAVDGTAGVDNRLRITLIRALGASDANAARAPLTAVARRQREDQSFLINRLALETLAARGEVANLEVLIEGLFLFGANPAMRMNDVAVSGLAQLGEAAVPPLLQVLAGRHPRARELAEAYVQAVEERVRNANVPSADQLMATEALYGLGIVGHESALDPLLETSRSEEPLLRLGAVMALVSLRPGLDDGAAIREALVRVYDTATDAMQWAQLVAAARRLGDPGLAPFLLRVAREGDRPTEVRLLAAESWALLAATNEKRAFRQLVRDRDIGSQLETLRPLLDEAERCSELECWVQAFQEHARSPVDVPLAEKAATRIGQLGRGDARAVSALVAQLGHRDIEVRLAALRALDWIAVRGSRAAVQRIEELHQQEEGRAIWTQFAREAIPIRARLIARGG